MSTVTAMLQATMSDEVDNADSEDERDDDDDNASVYSNVWWRITSWLSKREEQCEAVR